MEQEELNYERTEEILKTKYKLQLVGYGGRATSNKGKFLYNTYLVNCKGVLSQQEAKKRFLLGLLETLFTINTQKKLQEYLVVRPFTLHNLVFSVFVDVGGLNPDLPEIFHCRIRNSLGEITVQCDDLLPITFTEDKIEFASLVKDFQEEIPDYLKETVKQILKCPPVDEITLIKRYSYLKNNDESL